MRPTGFEPATDDELVELASQPEGGGGAIVEAMKRLREAVEKARVSADRHASRLFFLTWVLVVLTVVLAVPVIKEVWHWWR
jgi:hypothetical protein